MLNKSNHLKNHIMKNSKKSLSEIKELIANDWKELKTDIFFGFANIIFLSAFAYFLSRLIYWISL